MIKLNSDIEFNIVGTASFENINTQLITLSKRIEEANFSLITSKRLYAITIELLYNSIYHGLKIPSSSPEINYSISHCPNANIITLCSSNFVSTPEVLSLKKILIELNMLPFTELRKRKALQIKNGGISVKGGAGLGLIDICMKSDFPVQFSHSSITNEIDKITFTVKLKV